MLCGAIAVILAVQNKLVLAALFVGLGILFDFFDGFIARKLGVSSELGLQLDSLADVITSGIVPGIVMFQLLSKSLHSSQTAIETEWSNSGIFEFDFPVFALFGLLITLGSGYRLAKFNIDERQTSSFIGLPTPANAILILSLPLILTYQYSPGIADFILNPWVLVVLTLFSTYILNAEIHLFALKIENWSFKDNWHRYLLIIFTIILTILLKFIALPLVIVFYIVLSIILNLTNKNQKING